jgi:hypothetical protein
MNDPETRPSVGKDVGQDPKGAHPPPAPDSMRPSSNSAPATGPNPDPGYADQATMNLQNPDQQQNRGERPHVDYLSIPEEVRKAEIKKAVEEDEERTEMPEYNGLGSGGRG